MSSASRDVALLLAAVLALAACRRESRDFRADPVVPEETAEITMGSIAPGPGRPEARGFAFAADYEENAYQLSQGKALFRQFNCNGCHANGGGDSGPPLMDRKWIYGGSIENIAASIRQGRPNGMPSFGGRIPDDQIWQLAAYLRSMLRAVPADVAPARSDAMDSGPAENRRPRIEAIPGTSSPPGAEAPQ